MFGMFSVPWDFFHIGLLVLVIMIVITGMVICVSVIGVCCFHWLESLEENQDRQNSCQYDHQNQSVHVVVLPEKVKGGIAVDPLQLREHYQRAEEDRRFLHQNHHLGLSLPSQPQPPDGPPPSYEMLYPLPGGAISSISK